MDTLIDVTSVNDTDETRPHEGGTTYRMRMRSPEGADRFLLLHVSDRAGKDKFVEESHALGWRLVSCGVWEDEYGLGYGLFDEDGNDVAP